MTVEQEEPGEKKHIQSPGLRTCRLNQICPDGRLYGRFNGFQNMFTLTRAGSASLSWGGNSWTQASDVLQLFLLPKCS